MFYKMEKALDLTAAERAGLKAEINHLKEDTYVIKPYKRIRVREPANDRFNTIQKINAAKKATHKVPKWWRTTPAVDPTPAVAHAEEMIIYGLHGLRELEEMQ
jgi:hypothetical protein